jgi:hypothetical protein
MEDIPLGVGLYVMLSTMRRAVLVMVLGRSGKRECEHESNTHAGRLRVINRT